MMFLLAGQMFRNSYGARGLIFINAQRPLMPESVRQVRQKIQTDPEQPQYILPGRGVGYRLRAID
jgi:DNA-binding response OmpR family regulator